MTNLKGLPLPVSMHGCEVGSEAGALTVSPGDLWVLSWDQVFLGLVCVAAVKDGYILGWPVTLPDDVGFSPALAVDETPLKTPLLVWPTRETGLGAHLLHGSLGRLVDPGRIQLIAWAMEDGADPGLPFAPGSAADVQNRSADQTMLEKWARLCFHTWPETEPLYLAQAKVKQAGGSSAQAASCWGLTPAALRDLWTGVLPVSREQIGTLARALGVEPTGLLGDDPLREAVARLTDPIFKQPLLLLASRLGVSEGEARDMTRAEYALAARDDTLAVSDQRLWDAIDRVCRTVSDD